MSSIPTFQSGAYLPDNLRVTVDVNGQLFDIWDETRNEMYCHAGSQSQKAVWTWLYDWDKRKSLVAALLGGSTNVAGTTIYANGWVYPDNPVWLVQTIEVTPDGLYYPSDTGIQFQRARLKITFAIPEFIVGQPNNTGEQELDFCSNSEALDQGTTNFLWVSDNVAIPGLQAPIIRYTTVKFQQSIYNRAFLNVPLFISLVDSINSTPFFGAPVGTTRFTGARSTRKITQAGALNWDIHLSFENNQSTLGGTQAGWNKKWRPGFGWQEFKTKGTNLPFFPSNDLNQLLL